jgi:two-component system LytT family response regulator
MIKCIVIDDQKSAIDVIVSHIAKKEELQLIETFTDTLAALRFLEQADIDLVFTDMEMPHLSGIELMKRLLSKKGTTIPKFVFITGHSDYALPCFELGVRDYLLKPVGFNRFNTAVNRLIQDASSSIKNDIKNKFFFADSNGEKVKINLDDIIYVEGSGNYIKIMGNKIKVMTHRSLHSMQEFLPPEDFIRVHKSYIVSIKFIEAYQAGKLRFNINNSIVKIPTGVTFRNEVLKRLQII